MPAATPEPDSAQHTPTGDEATLIRPTPPSPPATGDSDETCVRPARAPLPTAAPAAGEAARPAPRYRIVRLHARGGLGQVFLAFDDELRREVALKEIRLNYSDDADCQARFLLEAEVTGRLEHPGIVPVYGLGSYADGRPYYAMRFVRGESLQDAIYRFHYGGCASRSAGERLLALRELLGRFIDVCHAMSYAHERGVLHRDLKPANIMLGPHGETLVVASASADELARDLERWLADEPVSVYPEPLPARLARWARRHRSLVTTTAALLLTAVVGLTLGTLLIWREQQRTAEQRRRAEKNLVVALDAVNSMLTEVAEKDLAEEPRMEQKRRNLLAKARQCYLDFLNEQGDDPGLLRAAALAHKRLGHIDRLLGRPAAAEAAYRDAIDQLADLAARAPEDDRLPLQEDLAGSWNYLGEVLRAQARTAEAQEAYRQAIRTLEPLAAAFPERAEYRRRLAQGHDNLVILSRQAGRLTEALGSSDRVLEILKPLADRRNAAPEDRKQLARAWLNRGTVLQDQHRLDDAAHAYAEAIRLQEALVATRPDAPDYRHELASCSTNLGILEGSRRRYAPAGLALGRSRELLAGLARDYPRIPLYRADLANATNSLGSVQFAAGLDHQRLAACALVGPSWAGRLTGCVCILLAGSASGRALGYWEEARAGFDRLVTDHPGVIDYRARRGMVLLNLVLLDLHLRDLPAARTALKEAVRDVDAVWKADSGNPFHRRLRDEQKDLQRRVEQAAADR